MRSTFLFLFLMTALSGWSVINVTGYQAFPTQSLSENVYIHAGGVMDVTGTITMSQYSIVIHNGGKLVSSGGEITADPGKFWRGVIVEPRLSTDPVFDAIEVSDFSFTRAIAAIDLIGEPLSGPDSGEIYVNPGIQVYHSKFDVNGQYHFDCGTANINGISGFDQDNITYGTNYILFVNTEFLRAGEGGYNGMWSTWVTKAKNIIFDHCLFDDDNQISDFGIHFNNVHNAFVFDCEFRYARLAGVVFHGSNENAKVLRSIFYPDAGVSSTYKGIGVGCVTHMGNLVGGTFSDNWFYGDQASNFTAICVGSDLGLSGSAEQLTIEGNDIYRYHRGIEIEELVDGSVEENIFSDYEYGIEVFGNTQSTYFGCNLFNSGDVGFNMKPGAIVDHWTVVNDHWNQFVSSSIDVRNYTGTPLDVNKESINMWAPVTTDPVTGAVNIINIISSEEAENPCANNNNIIEGKQALVEESVEDEMLSDFVVFPNPVSDGRLMIQGIEGPAEVTIHDMSGRVVMRQDLPAQSDRVELSIGGLESGTYLLNIRQNGQEKIVRIAVL